MNIAQAKQIPLANVLASLGHTPTSTQGDDVWYKSPFRDEADASFKINRRMNVWFDHGIGQGGTIIELIKELYRLPNVAATLAKIRELTADVSTRQLPLERSPARPTSASSGIEITDVKPVIAKSLLEYLAKRGIDVNIAEPFIKQVHYKARSKDYFAIGFANDAGGFELRNPYFKGSSSKDITTVAGDSIRVLVFEGFFDFLTAITINNGPLNGEVIVLNSVGMKEKAAEKIRSTNPQAIELYRDNDAAGQSLLTFFKQELPDINFVDKAETYQGFDDLNAWHVAETNSRKRSS